MIVVAGSAKLASCPGAADANERGGPGGETFLADRTTAYIAYFVHAGTEFSQRRVYRRQMFAALYDERRYVLPLEGDRRTLRVVLVVAPGRTLARTGNDGGELPLKFRDPTQRLVAIGVQPRLSGTPVSHLRHLSLKWQ